MTPPRRRPINNFAFLALALGLLWADAGVSRAAPASQRVLSAAYAGKYADHARLAEVKSHIFQALEDFPQLYRVSTGLTLRNYDHIGIELVDTLPDAQGAVVEALTQFVTETNIGIRIRVDRCLAVPAVAYRLTMHELTHAVQRRDLGTEALWQQYFPVWFREGIAVYVAGEISSRLSWDGFVALDREQDPMTLLRGLDSAAINYMECGLAVEYLDEFVHPGRLDDLIRHLTAGKDMASSIQEVYGLAWADFHAAADTHARERLRAMFPASFCTITLAARAQLKAGAVAEAQQTVAGLESSTCLLDPAFAAFIAAENGGLCARQENYAAARSHFEHALSSAGCEELPCAAGARFGWANALEELGEDAAAVAAFRELQQLYPYREDLQAAVTTRLAKLQDGK